MGRTLVLGANGFMGSHLVDELVKRGDEVVAFVRPDSTPKWIKSNRVEVFHGDYLNRSDLQAALHDISYVYHFISTTTPATAEDDPLIDIETNIRMSVELFTLCVNAGVKKVFFASTGGSIYGDNPSMPYLEDAQTLPYSPYAIGKLTIENYLRYFYKKHGLESVALRISNPYGERQPLHRKQGAIPIFIENILLDLPVTLFGDGSMVRDYVYVKDAAAMIAGIDPEVSKYPVYNIGSGVGMSLTDLINETENILGKNAKIIYKNAPSTFVHSVVLDTHRYFQEFSIRPSITLADGLTLTAKYIKEYLDDKH